MSSYPLPHHHGSSSAHPGPDNFPQDAQSLGDASSHLLIALGKREEIWRAIITALQRRDRHDLRLDAAQKEVDLLYKQLGKVDSKIRDLQEDRNQGTETGRGGAVPPGDDDPADDTYEELSRAGPPPSDTSTPRSNSPTSEGDWRPINVSPVSQPPRNTPSPQSARLQQSQRPPVSSHPPHRDTHHAPTSRTSHNASGSVSHPTVHVYYVQLPPGPYAFASHPFPPQLPFHTAPNHSTWRGSPSRFPRRPLYEFLPHAPSYMY
ncbi:hypothetical protein BJ138DRAFT_1165291 [Hygrophoropsis aurantiaca]|uniref:Uncharacterized protein n=1 Tax=Hygrophoropsis aurantiaca TaxID=72124 RepID=A0ACB7ZVJ7_9AGAM|nr:hypothetical protein BJ138DRAFT_1165291 [Hygrophoropsis aurantiaca]